MRILWQQHAQEEDWGFLLIDARNEFNEDNRTDILWEIRHEYPSGVWFSINCYRHWATLLIRAGNETGHFLLRKEGVTQGDTLAIIIYGIGILPLIQYLQTAQPRVTQPWYTDDSRAGGNFSGVMRHVDGLMV